MTKKGIVWLLPLVALLIGCGGKPTAQELVEVDSLLAVEKNDSAYQIIAAYDPASFENEADRAYYNLLMTHAAVVSYHWPESDSLINEAIRYYKRTGDKERLTDSYYYLANQYMHQEDWQKSIETLKLAEEQVEQTGSDWLKCKVYDALALVNERTATRERTDCQLSTDAGLRKESPRLCPAGGQKEYDRLCLFGNSPGVCFYGAGG